MINIRSSTAKLLKDEFRIDPEITEKLFERGILQEHDCKKALIKQEYDKCVKDKGRQILRTKIAEKFCVSVKLVEKVVF